jgi:hypothetical protein
VWFASSRIPMVAIATLPPCTYKCSTSKFRASDGFSPTADEGLGFESSS